MFGDDSLRKVACLGWYGHGNFGDELILEGLRSLFSGWEVYPFSSDGKGAYPELDFDVVNGCDLFVLGGGELVNRWFLWMPYPDRRFPVGSLRYRLYARTKFAQRSWVKRVRVPKVALGVGVLGDPLEVLDRNVAVGLGEFSYIGVRSLVDKVKLSMLEGLCGKVHLFYDLAFAVGLSSEVAAFLARVFPFKLHGYVLSKVAGVSYGFAPYCGKVRKVMETVDGLSLGEIRERQREEFGRMLECVCFGSL